MDTTHCHSSDEHTAIWACACSEPALNYCTPCLLTHLTSPGPHSPSSLRAAGPYTCGMCKGQVTDALSCRYPVCLCKTCMDRYMVTGVPGVHLGLHGDIQEAALKVQEEAHQEAALKIQAAVSQPNFKTLIFEKRADLMQHLTKALEDMNSLEDVKQRVLNTERELETSRMDVERLRQEKEKLLQQGGPQVHFESSQLARLEEMLERMETKQTRLKELEDQCAKLTSENQLLNSQVTSLNTQLHQTQQYLEDQQGLKKQVEALSKEVARFNSQDIAIQVNESISSLTEHLNELARTIAQKVADVLPLVAHLKVDEPWLDSESMESFFDLVRLGVQDNLDPRSIRKVSRVCAQVAKLVGPCKSVASFVSTVNKLLLDSPEKGKGLVGCLEYIYEKTLGHQSASDMLRGFLDLQAQDTNTFDEAIRLVAHFSGVLLLDQLCAFGIAMTHYLGNPGGKREDWMNSLSSLPTNWSEDLREQGEASVRSLIDVVLKNQFNEPCLQLSQLLSSYRPLNPEPLLVFTLRACDTLRNAKLEKDLEALFTKMNSYIDSTANLAVDVSHQRIEKVFLTMKLLLPGENATKDQLLLLTYALNAMHNGTKANQVMNSLLAVLQKLKDSDATLLLGFAVLAWVFNSGRGERDNVEFAGQLLKWFGTSDPRALNESVQSAVTLLKALTNVMASPVEACFGGLMDSGVEFQKVCALAFTLVTVFGKSPVAAQLSEFIINLFAVLDSAARNTRGELAEYLTTLMQRDNRYCEAVLRTSQCHAKLITRRCQPGDALRFTILVLNRFGTGGDNKDLSSLLREMITVLSQENQAYAVVFKSCELCVRASSRLPQDTRQLIFSTFILQQLQTGFDPVSIDNFLVEFLNILAQEKLSYSVAFKLAQLYTKYVVNTSTASNFLKDQLVVLRGLPPQGELEAVLQGIENMPLTPKEAMAFIQLLIQLCARKPAEMVGLTRAFINLVGQTETVELAQEIAIANFDTRDLLDVVCTQPTSEVIITATLLASMITTLAKLGTPVPLGQPLKNALIQRTADLQLLLASIKPMLAQYSKSDSFALQLLDELPKRSHDLVNLLCFVPQLLVELAPLVGPHIAVSFCQHVIMECFTLPNTDLLTQLQREPRQKLVDLLVATQGQVTLRDVEALFPRQTVRPFLPSVQASALRIFDCQQQTWGNQTALRSTIKADQYSSYTFLDDERIFCCGGECYVGYESFSNRYDTSSSSTSYSAGYGTSYSAAYAESYILNRTSGAVQQLSNMNAARYWHGILFYSKSNVVYVFGGRNLYTGVSKFYPEGSKLYSAGSKLYSAGRSNNYPAVNSCEMFVIATGLWQQLPNMQYTRYGFNPYLYQDIIYLCGYGSTAIEAFSPATNTFLPVPAVTLPESNPSCLVEHNDQLVVISNNYVTRFEIQGGQLIKVGNSTKHAASDIYQNCPPVLIGDVVFSSYNNTCIWIDVKTGARQGSK